jgi:Winged helix DNA-binding domain
VTLEVLTPRRLNRALLARQLLLERASLPIPAALERIGGIQNQYAPNAYIRLWSCLDGFEREQLTRAYERGTVVQGTLMRGTIHAVSARDYWPFRDAILEPMRAWAQRAYRTEDRGREDLVARVRASLRGRGVPRRELQALRGEVPNATWATIDLDAPLLRVPPSGTWERRRADVFALAEDRIGPAPKAVAAEGLAHLLRSYLRGFGPASVRDVSSYAGVPVTPVRSVLDSMSLRRYRDEQGGELVDLPRAPLPDAETPAPVRFLPTWDATLLVHARRTLILPERYRPLIFHTKMPPSYPTFLVDGAVAGTWKYADGEVTTTPFEPLGATIEAEVHAEARRLAAFHGAAEESST